MCVSERGGEREREKGGGGGGPCYIRSLAGVSFFAFAPTLFCHVTKPPKSLEELRTE